MQWFPLVVFIIASDVIDCCAHITSNDVSVNSDCHDPDELVMLQAKNILAGKLHPDYLAAVVKVKGDVRPQERNDRIQAIVTSKDLGPCSALDARGVEVGKEMLQLTGRELDL